MSPSGKFLGHPVPDVTAIHPHGNVKLVGKHVTLVGLQSTHAPSLYTSVGGDENEALWDFMLSGPYLTLVSFQEEIDRRILRTDTTYYTILSNTDPATLPGSVVVDPETGLRAVGMISLHRVDMPNRVVEVGNVIYGPSLARSSAATETMYLLSRHVFEDLKFRRYEWKANALNKPSARAAARLGFTYEGTFRQHMLRNGLNRDSVWYSMLDGEWDLVKKGFEGWLSEDNFDELGKQKKKLEDFREL